MPTTALLRRALVLPALQVALLGTLLAAAPAASADTPAATDTPTSADTPAAAATPAVTPTVPPTAAPAAPLGTAALPALSLPGAGARVVAEAATHKGKPYRWGATGPARFDCSGYVRYVFARLGKELPRTSRQQYAATRRIAKAAKQPGDLIFTRSSSGRINHVGIYAGAGSFWVAPKAGDVVKRQRIYTSNYSVGRV